MKVFKFGGASIETVERAKNIASLIQDFANEKLIVVISAKGKTTNALEKIVNAYAKSDVVEAKKLFAELENDHKQYAFDLLGFRSEPLEQKLNELCTEVEWVLGENYDKPFDYYYDQIVSVGELLSTSIIAAYLNQIGISTSWIDVRDIMKTDDVYRDAGIQWEKTEKLAKDAFNKEFATKNIVVTQGYIGSTDDNATATLGREGSDYSAAVFANIMDAESATIWKDVPSLLNADPKIFPNTIAIEEITFHEVIEMAYYGAQVIHPKTIKPLQNKNIPLYVKCFLDKNLKGTLIHNSTKPIQYPPIMVLKMNQILLQVNTRDYSFMTEDNLSKVYELFHDCKIKINLIQNAAISFVACVDSNLDRLEDLLKVLEKDYDVKRNENLYLFTVRHYTQEVLDQELKNRTILLEQKTRHTIQMVVQ
ncbi:MAG TPA: aspartate kinase [Chitinophagaceae bacterium]|nr:aspartate kinase [Chitinophagaceae bacterium]